MDFNKAAILEAFFQSLEASSTILITNWEETNQIEFKKSLHTVNETISKDYLKTISGFANNIGGVIVFGIDPVTKEIVGIKDIYNNLDNRYVSTSTRISLDGDMNFEFFTNKYLGKIVGFLTVREAKSKPIIFKADAGEAKLGEIYFRYPALTSKIGAGELRKILLDEITSKAQLFIDSFQKIVDVGTENIAILNTKTGEIESPDQSLKLTLNESILNKLNLIKRGEFVNEQGAPAYIIKGEIELEASQYKEREVPYVFTEKDVIHSFITGECEFPLRIIDYVTTLHTVYSPIYFFLKVAGMTSQEGRQYVQNINLYGTVDNTKTKIIDRLGHNRNYPAIGKLYDNLTDTIDFNKTISETIIEIKNRSTKNRQVDDMQIIRKLIFNTIINLIPVPDYIYKENLQRAIEAFSNLKRNHVLGNGLFYKSELKKISGINMDHTIMSNFRKVICMIDVYLYRD